MPWITLALCLVCLPAFAADGAVSPPGEPPPVVFEGLGLEGFDGARSVAAALRQAGAVEDRDPEPLKLAIRGPSGTPSPREPTPLPLAAEVRSRIERFDVAAGMRADPLLIQEGPAGWTGRIGVSAERETGSESLELRTILGRQGQASMLGVEVGPRIERRLPRGARVFFDGTAEARAVRSRESGWWPASGTTAGDSMPTVGVMARTGLVR